MDILIIAVGFLCISIINSFVDKTKSHGLYKTLGQKRWAFGAAFILLCVALGCLYIPDWYNARSNTDKSLFSLLMGLSVVSWQADRNAKLIRKIGGINERV